MDSKTTIIKQHSMPVELCEMDCSRQLQYSNWRDIVMKIMMVVLESEKTRNKKLRVM